MLKGKPLRLHLQLWYTRSGLTCVKIRLQLSPRSLLVQRFAFAFPEPFRSAAPIVVPYLVRRLPSDLPLTSPSASDELCVHVSASSPRLQPPPPSSLQSRAQDRHLSRPRFPLINKVRFCSVCLSAPYSNFGPSSMVMGTRLAPTPATCREHTHASLATSSPAAIALNKPRGGLSGLST
jgi:hypothetical protein